uniref:Uncharacterized protein n=1 Tax=Acrobeloides nanus TaxID=290746 RepID=A0A914EBV8_9BILA
MFENNEHQPLRIESEVNSPRVNSTWLIPTKDKPGEPSLKDYVKSLVRKSLLGNYKSPKLLPYTKPVTTLQRSTPTMPGTIRIVMPRILSSQSPSKRTL